MGSVYICIRKLIAIPETQVDVRLRREMEDCVDAVFAQCGLHVGRGGDVAVDEGEIGGGAEGAGVVQGGAVFELVEGNYVVGVGIG